LGEFSDQDPVVRSDQPCSSTANSVRALESTLPSESRLASSWKRIEAPSRTARRTETVPALVPLQRETAPSCWNPLGTWRRAAARRVPRRSIAALASQAATIPWSGDSAKAAWIRLRELPTARTAANGDIVDESIVENLAPTVASR